MPEIIMTFEWDGKTVHKTTKGFKGKDCVSKTKFLEEAVGDAQKREFTSEYYAIEKQVNKEKLRT